MSDFTPTTARVRDAYVRQMRLAFIASASEHEVEFDRWLAAHDAKVKAEALREAAKATSRPPEGAPYEVWAWCSQWLRDRADKV